MDELKVALDDHFKQMNLLFETFVLEIRKGARPAYDNFMGFFHAIDWTEPWLILLLCFHFVLLVTAITFRKKINFQMGLFVMALVGVYLAEKINIILAKNWEMFAGQNYFDPYGLFLSVLWSGPLLFISIIILINTLVSLCQLIVRWKRAELRHRARLARGKQD
ncbi:hypothetical protein AMTRI_Chr11g98320 [Amborella trichopoda]|uniref:Transmembrane protein 18 n=1 Tax=Amborella trichopoda TaxID=13333 RepID=W1PLJ3_AMBTC|nr:transmembrane protein 18 isoform X1 [Amborella trichopoda]ERN08551.1 hypothetical protein AMTR_s00017p00078270 [Amborella trichopoda]|eukprot:XP_006846970.1 transmembrane protein 18 isoform X1 [Amborella trichopoda]